jgi:hypothetical protein
MDSFIKESMRLRAGPICKCHLSSFEIYDI